MNPSSKLRVLSVLAIFAAIFTTQAHAILDQNNNSISDLWEKQHNNGNLFPTTFLATNDEDQDGWTNGKEAIAGTNPFEATPPDGIVAVIITPSLVNGAFTLTWPTLIGKNYQLQASTDLLNWSNLGEPVTTNQSTHAIGINTTQPDQSIPPTVFWQVAVTDLDTDGDGLTNTEEHALGLDPQTAFTIPGLPDLWLATHFATQLLAQGTAAINTYSDEDADGLTIRKELEEGTDPNKADTDNDTILDGNDADPLDPIINWQKSGRPTFAVIEIPVSLPDEINYVDHSQNGTILSIRQPLGQQSSAVIIDKQQNVHEKDFIWVTHLHDDLVPQIEGTETSDDSLYDPITDTFFPWNCPTNYLDSISDVRDGLVIGKFWLMQTGMDERLSRGTNGEILPGQEQNISAHEASIDREGNIASVSHYWKKEQNGSYSAKLYSTAHQSLARAQSAVIRQVIAGVEKKWTLVSRPGTAGLQVAQDAAFAKATKRFGTKSFRAVTRQGWIFDEDNKVWTSEKWETLLEILGSEYTHAELLAINDEGLAVAKIQKENGPMQIGLLIPVEIQLKDENRGEWFTTNELKIAKWEKAFDDNGFRNEHPEGLSGIFSDVDRFRIRINTQHLPEAYRKIYISTTGFAENAYNDNPTEVLLELDVNPYGNSDGFISKPIILVADAVDNKFKNDNDQNDQTHIAALGSNVEFRIKQANGGLVGRLPVHKKKIVHVDLILLWQGEDGPSELALNKMAEDIKVTREIYAQVGIDVQFTTGAYQVNASVDLSDGLTLSTIQNPGFLHSEGEAILNAFGTPNNQTDVVGLYVDGRIYSASSRGGEVQGTAFWDNAEVLPHVRYPISYWSSTVPATYKGNFLVSTLRLEENVLAHELGHVLGLLHRNDEKVQDHRQAPRNLLNPGAIYDGSYQNDTKRLMLFQEKRMHNSQFIKNTHND